MTEIFFYKLKNLSIELFLISLIEKSISKNWNSLVLLDNIERMEEINDLMWTFNDTSFIPHGSQSDLNPDKHNVYLTCNEENLNNSSVIFNGRRLYWVTTNVYSDLDKAKNDLVNSGLEGWLKKM